METESGQDFPESPNRTALERTIVALPGLKPEHAALIQHARSLANTVDAYDGDLKLHTEYRHVLSELLAAGKGEALDEYATLMQRIADDAKRATEQGASK